MDLGLSGRTALVLGAGGGLGRAIALGLAREGANLVIADRDAPSLAATSAILAEIAGGGAPCLPIVWDLGDAAATDRNVALAEERFGGIDILVNNTGGPPPSPASGVDPKIWAAQFEAMVLSVIRITDRVLPGMRTRRWGRVVTSASSGVVAPIPNLALSNALRLSLVGWSKSLAREVAADGVTVNVVLPGRIATDRIRFLDESKAARENRPVAEIVAESTAAIPMARYGEPREYADAVAFLASERAAYVTGSILRVDGGYIPSI